MNSAKKQESVQRDLQKGGLQCRCKQRRRIDIDLHVLEGKSLYPNALFYTSLTLKR